MVTVPVPKAALDIGSNTVRLLVARYSGGILEPIEDASEFVRLGRGVDASGELQDDRMSAAIGAIERLEAKAVELGANGVIAIATSAVRDASNRDTFVRRVRAATGVEIRILSGDEEARLTYLGAMLGNPIADGVVICDLGGGSAELIFATPAGVEWAKSLQLGSGRLTEQFVHHDPPEMEELEAAQKYVVRLLRDLPLAHTSSIILTGGTASHITSLLGKSGEQVSVSQDEIMRVWSLVQSESAQHLVQVYGVRPERAEVLPAGITAAATIVDFYGTEHVTITRHGIREGVIIDDCAESGSQQN